MASNSKAQTIAIFGANGRVGRLVVAKALEQHLNVIAFVHGESGLPRNDALTVIRGEVRNAADVRRALREATVVISTLGSWGTKSKDILATGMKTIVPVMEELGLKRIVSLTGADAVATSDTPGFANRLSRKLIGIVGGKVIADGEEHIRILQASSLNWTIVRSPVMLGGQSKPYRLTVELAPPYISIRRQSVADAMLSLALNDEFNQQLATILPAKQ